MSLVCLASQKGSPGVTLGALALTASWPTDVSSKLLLEADADGGVLALRYGLGRQPGLLTLAAAGRHGLQRDEVWEHAQQLPGGLGIIPCPDIPGKSAALLQSSGSEIGSWLANRPDLDVIVDCGRLGPSSPAVNVAVEADLLLMVARPTAEQLQPAAERMFVLQTRVPQVAWLLVGEEPHTVAEIEDTYGLPVAGVLASDPRGAKAMTTGATPKRIRRSALVRSAAGVAEVLHAWLHPDGSPVAATDDGSSAEPVRPVSKAPPTEGPQVPAKEAVAIGEVGDGEIATAAVLAERGPAS